MNKDTKNALLQVSRRLITTQNRVLEDDLVAIEEPLQIRLLWAEHDQQFNEIFTITMRTPGDDKQLATGLLLTEGVINSVSAIINCFHETENGQILSNQLSVELAEDHPCNIETLNRRLVSHSSCGICGKTSLQQLELKQPPIPTTDDKFLSTQYIIKLSPVMLEQQQIFNNSGGVHAAGLFNQQGELISIAEDIGRHNAVDKLIGEQLLQNNPATGKELLFTSGRASFELVQKTLMAGYPVLAAVGAPTSLAIAAAKRFNMTLIGFVSTSKFNVYTGEWRFIDSSTV